jgi:hypothetical protein
VLPILKAVSNHDMNRIDNSPIASNLFWKGSVWGLTCIKYDMYMSYCDTKMGIWNPGAEFYKKSVDAMISLL